MGRENHNRKDRFLCEKTQERKKLRGEERMYQSFKEGYTGAVIRDREFNCFSPPSRWRRMEEKEYLYKSKDDIELASISSGCNHCFKYRPSQTRYRHISRFLPAADTIWENRSPISFAIKKGPIFEISANKQPDIGPEISLDMN